ncbi:cache domain-containing sensor histidine kinase [Anaerosacchariphilus polymeriproducens]|uniref:histidine kinase n=1 Tax=Anaerosacchariphilus polymeriproducens TaxID=1812858 RepID=A0A371AVT2_9FIRM|nr:sensor histidine kinase [Anaerosacchariphilus polymeriproducens]RDU23695.1 sensor histidine kinase [Anaerosacchariphilus polymeriproducens]
MRKRRVSVRILLPLIMSISIAVCILTCMLLFSHYLSVFIVDSAEKEVKKQKEALAQGIEQEIEDISDLINTIYYQNIKINDFSDEEFSKLLCNIFNDNSDRVYSISIYDIDGNCIFNTRKDNEKNVVNKVWFNNSVENIESIQFGDDELVCNTSVKRVIPVSKYIEYARSNRMNQGVLCVTFYTDYIEQILNNYGSTLNEYCYLVDANNELLYHPYMRAIESDLYEEKTLEKVQNIEKNNIVRNEGTNWIIYKQQLGYTGWNVVVVNSLSYIKNDNLNIYYVVWLILLIIGAVLITLDVVLLKNFTDPIYKLLRTMESFGRGNYEIKADENGIGELKVLSEQFNVMAEKLQKQMDEIRRNEHEKRKMEKKLLQSQINPHFLYNTLDSIIWMIQSGEYCGAEQMVSLLAKFFRISLSQGKDIIPLKKELEHATSYLAIQNIRFKDKFEFHVHADSELTKYLCPKLIIQPLLENAIYHGMEGMYDDGEIDINVYEKDGIINIDVVDNGLGMTEDKIDYIMHNKVVSSKRGSGIGVRNVNERIRLIYGEQYGISMISELDEGTTAKIMIPMLEEVDDK